MKKHLLFIALGLMAASAAHAEGDNAHATLTLDLSKSTTPLSFNEETGAWTDTYNDDATAIVSQCFTFVHGSMSEYSTWWGFTASNSTDNARQENTIKFQFSNMAAGGIALNEDGTVKLDSFGAPVVDKAMPYLVGYYSPFMGPRSVDMAFVDGKSYDPVGVYINLNSYPYYCIEYGDSYARAFTNGDHFTLTVHGIAPDASEKSIEVDLASYANGNLTINRGWSYVDLSALGTVNEIYFSMKSTDSGDYGDNTPTYFCLDKLTVKEPNGGSAIESVGASSTKISYNRAEATVNVGDTEFAAVFDATGRRVLTSSEPTFSIAGLEAGIYVVRAGEASLKIAR